MVDTFSGKVEVLVGRGRFYFESAAKVQGEERNRLKKESIKSLEKAVALDPENEVASALLSQVRRL